MGAKRLSERDGDRAPSISRAPSGDAKFRVVVRLLTTPRGRKGAVARLLAAECARSTRTVCRWEQLYRKYGLSGLAHPRLDRGVPQLYSSAEFGSVIAASVRLRRYPRSNMHREWKALGLPGSYETFRWWIRRLQVFGFIEAPSQRGELSA